MKAEKKHYVTFESPGTLFAETTRKPISAWDTKEACSLAKEIVGRHGARPFSFRFSTMLEAPPIAVDGAEGEKLDVTPKQIAQSDRYYLGGETFTYEQVVKRRDPGEHILRTNMRNIGYAIVIENRNSYRSTRPFEENDAIVDPVTGAIRARGNDPEMKRVRAEQLAIIERDNQR